MVERLISAGQSLRTQDVFENVVRARADQGVGEIWLDGDTPTRPTTTSLAVPPFLFAYSLASRAASLQTASGTHTLPLPEDETFWDLFSQAQKELSSSTKYPGRGWRGGWVGWFGYEMKEESLQGYHRSPSANTEADEVDACWAWCNWILERSVDGKWILRGLVDDSLAEQSAPVGRPSSLVEWLKQVGVRPSLTSSAFDRLASEIESALSGSGLGSGTQAAASMPRFRPDADSELYQSRIDQCRESIRQGDSYELTMTTSFHSRLPECEDPYALYLRLRTANPAYYSTWLSFPSLSASKGKGIHILSSSPERFLKIEKEQGDRMVEMMPIKGTQARVKPGQCVCADDGCKGKAPGSQECIEAGEREDKRRGEALRNDPKERAENLMVSMARLQSTDYRSLTLSDPICSLAAFRPLWWFQSSLR